MNTKHKIIIPLLAILVCTAMGLVAQVNPNPSAALDAFIQSEMNVEKFPGVSTVIVKNGEIVWLESYGFADIANNIPVQDTTVFLLASVSKVFTGTAMMQLHENGTVRLDDNINNHLPWSVVVPGYASTPITPRRLMTHTASIQDNEAVMDNYYDYPDPSIALSDCMEGYFTTTGIDYSAADNFIASVPGTVYEYSNIATALNGYVVEAATGSPFDQYCTNNIFAPLGMTKTAWYMSDFDSTHVARPYGYTSGNYFPYPHYGFADYPNGQLRSHVVDLSKFMIAYLNGGTLGSQSILSAASINQMWSNQIPSLEVTQGLSWYQEELFYSGGSAMLWGHNGGEDGASTDMYLDPANNIGICVLTNGEGDALTICDELYDYALTLSTTSTDVQVATDNIELFPNPVEGYFTVKGVTSEYTIQIVDALGQVYQTLSGNGEMTVEINDLPAGLFFISIQNNTQHQLLLQKIIKGH